MNVPIKDDIYNGLNREPLLFGLPKKIALMLIAVGAITGLVIHQVVLSLLVTSLFLFLIRLPLYFDDKIFHIIAKRASLTLKSEGQVNYLAQAMINIKERGSCYGV